MANVLGIIPARGGSTGIPNKNLVPLCGRPLLALYHAESTATDLLRRFGGPPAVRLITYDGDRPASTRVDEIATHLRALVRNPACDEASVDRHVLDAVSARALAGRLAGVFDRVSRAADR